MKNLFKAFLQFLFIDWGSAQIFAKLGIVSGIISGILLLNSTLPLLSLIPFFLAFFILVYFVFITWAIIDDEDYERKMMQKGIDTRPFWLRESWWMRISKNFNKN